MGKKKVLLVIAFVVIAMVSGGIVSIYAMNKSSVEGKGSAQAEIIDKVQPENKKTTQAEIKSEVQEDKMAFSCGISGCTQTEVHVHNGEYCYPHSADDGHAYHNCGVLGCTEMESHTHNSCGVKGCTQTGEHSHGVNGVGHHQSGHGGGHH
ncbi:MAG: hypothetical protein HDT39_00055 [Lachnospiraceae bacterium]|nr:hypothetical protein [Lachnospiraceae bacterium]